MDQTLRSTRGSGARVLAAGAAGTLAVGLLAALVVGLAVGRPAGLGVLVGTLMVVVVGAGGALLVNAVAGALPAASMVIALLTYTLQVLVLLVVLVAVERSGWLDSSLDRVWVGAAVVGATLMWLATQVAVVVRARIPAFDLPTEPTAPTATGPAERTPEGGESR